MSLAPTLGSVSGLHRKLERENYRAIHASSRVTRADHFYNFCITAHAMRDYFFEEQGLVISASREPFNIQWKTLPILVAVEEIANSAKHFVLREMKPPRHPRHIATRGVRRATTQMVGIYQRGDGTVFMLPRSVPDLSVTLSDGQRHALWEFMDRTVEYWRSFLRQHGIIIRRQPFGRLSAT